MSEFSRGLKKFYVTNPTSDSEGNEARFFPRRPVNGHHQPRRPHPLPTPPIVTTQVRSTRYQSSHASLSSPSSTSSPAADESTPPPSTPGPSLSSNDSPGELVADVAPLSTRKPAPTIAFPTHRSTSSHPHPPTLSVRTRRPSTSPSVSTPENLFSPASTQVSTSSANTGRLHILVRGDSDIDRFVNVDITGATSAAFIRECVFTKLEIADDEQRHYSIYHTEIGAFAVGGALSDDRLLELCLKHGDSKGSLKLLVSSSHTRAQDIPSRPPSSMSSTPTLLPPVVIPQYSGAASCAPLRPRRRSRSRPDSASSGDHPQLEPSLSAGYEADVDNPEHATGRPLPSTFSPATPSSPRRGRPLHGPTPRPISPGHPNSSDGSSYRLPTPIGTEHTTIRDRYGNVLPPPPPPPPLSPAADRHKFVIDEDSLRSRRSFRASSDASDRDAGRAPLHGPEVYSPSSSLPRTAHINRMKETSARERKPKRPATSDAIDPVASRTAGTSVNGDTMISTASKSSRLRSQISPTQYTQSSSPYRGRSIPMIPKTVRSGSSGGTGLSPETRTGGRNAGQQVPANWAVAWKGEGGGAQKVVPSSSSQWKAMKGAKSMDNLKHAFGSHPAALQAGGPRRNAVPSRGTPLQQTKEPSSPATPRSHEARPNIRPLPSLGQSTTTPSVATLDLTSSGPIRIPNRSMSPTNGDPYPRPLSAFGDTLASPSRFMQSPTHADVENHHRTARGLSPATNALPIAPRHPHHRHSDLLGSPPTSPVSPRSPDEHGWIFPLDSGMDSNTIIPTHVQTNFSSLSNTQVLAPHPHRASTTCSSSGDSDQGTGTALWQVPPASTPAPERQSSRPPSLTVQISDDMGTRNVSIPSAPGSGTIIPRDRSPANGTYTASYHPEPTGSKSRTRGRSRESTFVERDISWAPRPPPEQMLDRLEKFFPDHDLDKPVIDAGSGGTSPTSIIPTYTSPLPSVAPLQPNKTKARAKKSIRYVAQEHKKRVDRTSRIDPALSAAENMARKRSTQLWDNKLEEVTAEQLKRAPAQESPAHPSSPSTEGTLKWVRGELIGRGTYGKVYLALNMGTGEVIAVKQVELPKTESDRNNSRQITVVQALKMESDTLRVLDHPNIVQYLGFEETPDNLSIFLEYVPGGSIGSCLLKHGSFSEDVTKSFMVQILGGLEYLHSKGVVHRDLKADNILVEETGVCKISDFGISKRTTDYGGAATAMQGTVFWMAPEVVNPQGKGYGFKVDIWSVGCVVLEMWAGSRPWQGDEMVAVMFKLYNQKLPPPIPEGITLTELGDDFRRQCFAINPDERPPAAELRRHKYLELTPGWVFDGHFS